MNDEKLNKFTNDFTNKYGIMLQEGIKGNNPNKVKVFVNRIITMIFEEIKARNPTFSLERITKTQNEAIYNAVLEQSYYVLINYDMYVFLGLEPTTGGIISQKEIDQRAISPLAKKMLSNAGLFYAGFSRGRFINKKYVDFWVQ